MKYLSTPSLFFLFITFRLMCLLLYRPGGLLGVGEPYIGWWQPQWVGQLVQGLGQLVQGVPQGVLGQLLGGLLLLPFEIGSLWLLLELLRRDYSEEEARRRALLWAASPLPLWAWLTSAVPIVTFLLLAAYWVTGLERRSWLWAALPLAFATLIQGATAFLTTLLLPFILLLLPEPTSMNALFTLAALLAGPVRHLLGVTTSDDLRGESYDLRVETLKSAATAFQMGYILALTPILTEWLLNLSPARRKQIFAIAALSSLFLFTIALFMLAPRELHPIRLAASPLAPALSQMQSAPAGWFITDSHELWEQSVTLGTGKLNPYVVSTNNLERLRSQLLATPAPIWVLQSQSDKAALLLEPLLADFYPADEQLLADGTRLRPFVSGLEAPLTPVNGTFTDGISLTNVRIPDRAQAGSLLPIELEWLTGQLTIDDLRLTIDELPSNNGAQKLFLHLIAPDGTLATQRDTLLGISYCVLCNPREGYRRHALILPATLAPGTYTLLAGRYDPETGVRVPLIQGGDTITLGEVLIK